MESHIRIIEGMETAEIVARLKASNRKEVAEATGLPYMYLSRIAWEHIKNPGSRQTDKLRAYFMNQPRADTQEGVPSAP